MTTRALLLASTLVPAFAILAPAAHPAIAEPGMLVVAQAEPRRDDEEDRRKKEQQRRDQPRKDQQPQKPGAQGQPAQEPGAQPPPARQRAAPPERRETPSTPPAVQQRREQERRGPPAPAAQERRDQPPPAATQQGQTPPAAEQKRDEPPQQRERPARQERPAVQQGQEQPGAPRRRDQRPAPTGQQPAQTHPTRPGAQPPAQAAPTVQQPAAPQQPATQTRPTAPAQPTPTVQAPAGPTTQQQRPQRLDQIQGGRREERQGNRTVIREGDRTIVRESGGRTIIRHNEVDRFRIRAQDVRTERRGRDTATVIVRPGGVPIVTVVDDNGRLLRRSRRGPDGREVVIIDNRPRMGGRDNYFVVLPPPVIRIPRERYILEAERARPEEIYEVLMEPPVERLPRAYSLDEIRYSPAVRERMPRVDLDTITFETGSWEITPDQVDRLAVIADAIKRAIDRNPNEVFLVEGHTDATGADVDNLSLSDRRAESVAIALTDQFQIPAENLTTQGYGEQYLKVPTQGPERANRRVTIRRITPLLTGQNEPQPR